MINKKTGEHTYVESKYNGSKLTPNQKKALSRSPYPVIIDRTTSQQFGNASQVIINGGAGIFGNTYR